eukprot:gnl/TRDRNA2_/TRDRNA2_61593_c0_seq1.p1 gnl/TRDRNA2_/TRDRNA2_61593_c0~~gnl/TRDRNA2_/TRDRNA2_61593_c0_seq1.p1  ORF type:complete len:367 (-),score=54.75 gnl/TRDRNA2_/TRDRNA2_61593_c0_seq1:4-1104(-)
MTNTRCMESLEVSLPGPGVPATRTVKLKEARMYLHTLMRRAIEPSSVYAHDWKPGDVAVWDNFCVWHSATGGLAPSQRRVMHLVAFDGSKPPECRYRAKIPRLMTDKARHVNVLALIIGQSPRPDLCVPLRKVFSVEMNRYGSSTFNVCEVGALDSCEGTALEQVIESGGPLITRLQDGRSVRVSEPSLAPLLHKQLTANAHAAETGIGPAYDAAILMCAGEFAGLSSVAGLALVKPFMSASAVLRAVGIRRVVLVVPNSAQAAQAPCHWRRAVPSLETATAVVLQEDHDEQLAPSFIERSEPVQELVAAGTGAVVLDFVGHPASISEGLRRLLPESVIVLDVGIVAMNQLAGLLVAGNRDLQRDG